MFDLFFREDKGDQILDYKQEIQTMEEQLKKLQKEVQKVWFMLLRGEVLALGTQKDIKLH